MTAPDFTLTRNAFGRLELLLPDGRQYSAIIPVRAFPMTAPAQCIALVNDESHEVLWIDNLQELPEETRTLIEDELANREFVPVITRIDAVSAFSTPSTWQVHTDRGQTTLVLKGEEDIRRLGDQTLIIGSQGGVRFLIADVQALDRKSRRFLDRFL